MKHGLLTSVMVLCAAQAWAQTFAGAAALDSITEQAIKDGYIPGAVLLVGHEGKIVFRKAYGSRALVPQHEAATVDTIYDAASLTKVIATTPAMMKLVEQGKVRLGDPVTAYLPEFQGGASEITVRDLMTHFSGLRPDLDLEPVWSGYETGIHKALIDKPADPPGAKFVYSDINFELLGEIVHRVSGKTLDVFVREQIYQPLGMRDTMYLPPATLLSRIAPTEIDATTGKPLHGVVHDPTARYMGGVAGHAGVFTTADDLAVYAQMMLGLGERGGVRIFAPLTVQRFTSPATPPGQPVLRGLGWDIDSPYSSNRGEIYPLGGYGHTGFTGPSLWIDPSTQSFVVIMTNRNHPKGGRSINSWRSKVASVVAAAVSTKTGAKPIAGGVRNGLDVLAAQNFASLQGQRVGLITNQTGIDRQGRRNVGLMRASGVNLITLFSPEHGIAGHVDVNDIPDSTDADSGLPIRSMYDNGRTRVKAGMFAGLDAIVFDIQDVGARFYTYQCLMLDAMQEAAKADMQFYVLDRPNPITGSHVEGPQLDAALHSPVGCYDLPVRHGMTMGELATMANAEQKWNVQLHIVRLEQWSRGEWFDATGLPWVDPSPNMRSLHAATLYPGIALLEAAKDYSVGRGTDTPFEQIGAEWIKSGELAAFLTARNIRGITVYPLRFRPEVGAILGDKALEGVRFVVTDRDIFDAVGFGLELAYALQKLYPGKIDFEACRNLIGNRAVLDALKAGQDPTTIATAGHLSIDSFLSRRMAFLLY
ncbi:MAG: exo-beta-N-acetylmuramidase NamZ domain-containing protein [Acidobacteriota bacterium]